MAGYGNETTTDKRPSKRALELYRWLRAREADFEREGDTWSPDRRGAYIDAKLELDTELGRKPWQECIWNASSPVAPAWQRRQGPAAIADYADAHEVRMMLERLTKR